MAKDTTNFDRIMAGLADIHEMAEGRANPATYRIHHVEVPETVNVRAIRKRAGLTQAAFAARFGFSKAAVTDWEQGRRKPKTTARVLLTVIDREPEAVDRALQAG